MSGTQQTVVRTLVWETCCKCGVGFGLDSEHRADLVKTHASFYCPNGHGQAYLGKSEAERERERANKLEQQLADERERRQHDANALTLDVREAQQRAKRWSANRGLLGAFWRGYTDRECGREVGCCPYASDRGGFRRAWLGGMGLEWFPVDGDAR